MSTGLSRIALCEAMWRRVQRTPPSYYGSSRRIHLALPSPSLQHLSFYQFIIVSTQSTAPPFPLPVLPCHKIVETRLLLFGHDVRRISYSRPRERSIIYDGNDDGASCRRLACLHHHSNPPSCYSLFHSSFNHIPPKHHRVSVPKLVIPSVRTTYLISPSSSSASSWHGVTKTTTTRMAENPVVQHTHGLKKMRPAKGNGARAQKQKYWTSSRFFFYLFLCDWFYDLLERGHRYVRYRTMLPIFNSQLQKNNS